MDLDKIMMAARTNTSNFDIKFEVLPSGNHNFEVAEEWQSNENAAEQRVYDMDEQQIVDLHMQLETSDKYKRMTEFRKTRGVGL